MSDDKKEFRAEVVSWNADARPEARVDLYTYVPSGILQRIRDGAEVTVTVRTPPVKVGDVLHRVEEIQRCPTGTVLVDHDGDAWKQAVRDQWYIAGAVDQSPGGNAGSSGTRHLQNYEPLTVVWVPEVAA